MNTAGVNPGARSFRDYGNANGTYHTSDPQVGDAVVFNNSSGVIGHVGLVVSMSGGSFTYISGNSGSNTDSITQRTLSIVSATGFASPVPA